MIHTNVHGDREKYHKFPLSFIIKEINSDNPYGEVIEERPRALWNFYNSKINKITLETDKMFITVLIFAECWLLENEYIKQPSELLDSIHTTQLINEKI